MSMMTRKERQISKDDEKDMSDYDASMGGDQKLPEERIVIRSFSARIRVSCNRFRTSMTVLSPIQILPQAANAGHISFANGFGRRHQPDFSFALRCSCLCRYLHPGT